MAKHRIQDIIILPNSVWVKVTFLYDENNYNKFFNFDLFVLTDLFYLLGKMNTAKVICVKDLPLKEIPVR